MTEMGFIEATRLPKLTPRLTLIENKNQKQCARVNILNNRLDDRLERELATIKRREIQVSRKHDKELTFVQDELLKIKLVDNKPYMISLPEKFGLPQGRNEIYNRKPQDIFDTTASEHQKHFLLNNHNHPHHHRDSKSKCLKKRVSSFISTTPVTPPPSVQQIRKMKEDILDDRNKLVHYNNVTFTHAIAVGNQSGGGWKALLRNKSNLSGIGGQRSRVGSAVSAASSDVPVKLWNVRRERTHTHFRSDSALKLWNSMSYNKYKQSQRSMSENGGF